MRVATLFLMILAGAGLAAQSDALRDPSQLIETAPAVYRARFDTSKGPVVIDRQATVGASSVLNGPCYVGPFAVVRPLTLIREGTSIGIASRVGGEISNSIILGYSNKAHDGYLGDSYVGKWVNGHPTLAPIFTLEGPTLALLVTGYGFAASVIPVWLLLAPRDYLSAFVKIGVVVALALGILIVLPPLQMPALTQFTDGSGPVFAGKVFPFVFTTSRLTEHHTAGGMSRYLEHLAELQPEMFVEVSPALAEERGLEHMGWCHVITARSAIEGRVMVTERASARVALASC
jgi:hypothetical protein